MNKGILCGECNGAFSPLDDALARQLAALNGLIGVRRDRDDEPRPARTQSDDGVLLIDHHGQPSFEEPRVLGDEPLPDGRRAINVAFPNEQAAQQWIAEQRALGKDVKTVSRTAGERFPVQAGAISWTFGGEEAFREVGRIALNFLANEWPEHARHPDLNAFKDFVWGPSPRGASSATSPADSSPTALPPPPRRVWHATAAAFPLPDSPFSFGHQILLKIGDAGSYARVRFFSAFDLFVWFGPLRGAQPAAVVVDIDPLADRPPDDVRFSALPLGSLPATIDCPPHAPDVGDLLRARTRELLARIEDRQWSLSTAGLLEQINAARAGSGLERANRVERALEPHLGRVLSLARHVATEARSRAQTDAERFAAQSFEELTAADAQSRDGLTALSRVSLRSAARALSEAIARELDQAPLDHTRLRLLLAGGPGAAIVSGELARHIIAAVARA